MCYDLHIHIATLLCQQKEFNSVPLSVIQTFVMMVGELNYQNNFLDAYLNNELPFGFLTYAIFVNFVLLMPILLVNLMVSVLAFFIYFFIAVGKCWLFHMPKMCFKTLVIKLLGFKI